jgi:hypothetical protein
MDLEMGAPKVEKRRVENRLPLLYLLGQQRGAVLALWQPHRTSPEVWQIEIAPKYLATQI